MNRMRNFVATIIMCVPLVVIALTCRMFWNIGTSMVACERTGRLAEAQSHCLFLIFYLGGLMALMLLCQWLGHRFLDASSRRAEQALRRRIRANRDAELLERERRRSRETLRPDPPRL